MAFFKNHFELELDYLHYQLNTAGLLVNFVITCLQLGINNILYTMIHIGNIFYYVENINSYSNSIPNQQ